MEMKLIILSQVLQIPLKFKYPCFRCNLHSSQTMPGVFIEPLEAVTLLVNTILEVAI